MDCCLILQPVFAPLLMIWLPCRERIIWVSPFRIHINNLYLLIRELNHHNLLIIKKACLCICHCDSHLAVLNSFCFFCSYTFICYQNVTLVSYASSHRTPSSIFCMVGMLIINSLSFFFPWKVITSLIWKGSLAGKRNLSWGLISFRTWDPSFLALRGTC